MNPLLPSLEGCGNPGGRPGLSRKKARITVAGQLRILTGFLRLDRINYSNCAG